MEKVIDLFKSFRNKEIEYDELFGALTKMLSEDPLFSGEAVSALDKAQQQTPIPVTDFINLRAKVENTATTFQQQEISHGPADAEATMIFAGEEATTGPGDPTLMAAPAPTPTIPDDDYADEATVIMPMPPRQSVAAAAAPVAPTAPVSELEDEHATLIAVPPVAEAEDEHATLIASPTPSKEPTPVPQPVSAPEPTPSSAAPTPKETAPKPPFVLIGSGVAALLVIILVIALWPSSDNASPEPVAASNSANEEAASPWGNDAPMTTERAETVDIAAPEKAIPETTLSAETLPDEVAPETIAIETITEKTEETIQTTDEQSIETIAIEEAPAEPVVKDEAYFASAIQAAVNEKNLSPAEKEGTATYFLVELIKLNKDSDKISEARTLISKKHLELAKESRTSNQWDAAQQHLDDALKVRLPDSYLPE